ncbi:uncharacterized protein LOC113352669 [Papaver somniferum]|uniref:uncharacterized protein LOC113352669 n=1 Tax=Papaver somniferum TaxID=3469 RepID=UPI000E6F4736|nr:uncharacterized protein LOC113352669 [Papaver somniferum]
MLLGSNSDIQKPLNCPFKFQKMWISHPGFLQVVIDAWKEIFVGNTIFIFMNKLKFLKNILKKWNWEVFGNVQVKLKEAEEKVLETNILSDAEPQNLDLLNNYVIARGIRDLASQNYHTMLSQKARVNWIKYGDANTSFFHTLFKLRQTRNSITELENDAGDIVTDQKEIAPMHINHFSKYSVKRGIRNVVFDLNEDGFPGPDGFTGIFYRIAWEIIEEDLFEAIRYSWQHQVIPPGVNSNFLVLLPKVRGAKKGRNIDEKILLASELVNEMNIKRRGGNAGFKLDISQAYDILRWEYLILVLKKYGFSAFFCNWILVLLKSTKISIMINGGPVGYFGVGRCLKQGDTLSPILYVIAADVLSINILHPIQENKIQPMIIRKGIHPSHLFFADDIFIFCNGGKSRLLHLKKLLIDYQKASGQTVSATKSKCFVGGTSLVRGNNQIDDLMNMKLSYFPDKYLGVILVQGKAKTEHLWSFVEIFHRRLASWIGNLLDSQARITLIKFVLSSIPLYNISMYKWPRKVIDACERIIRNFLWSGNAEDRKCVTISWDQVCSPIEEGGLDKYDCWITYYKKSSICPGIKWVLRDFNDHTRWIVGKGDKISVWMDTWVLEQSIIKLFPDNAYIQQHIHMKNGLFTVASVVSIIITRLPKLRWYKHIWNKSVHLSTVAIFGRLQGEPELLMKIQIKEDFKMFQDVIFAMNTRIPAHLLWVCKYGQNIWSWLGGIFSFKNPKSFEDILFCGKSKSSVVQKIWIIAAFNVMVDIWLTGNKAFFENITPDVLIAKKKILKMVKDCEFIAAESGGLGITTNFVAEVMGTLCALEWAVQHNKCQVIVNSDSKEAISVFSNNNLPWFVLVRWKLVCSVLRKIHFNHVYTEINFSVDFFAKKGCHLQRGQVLKFSDRPSNMQRMEFPGVPYYRFE